jgi:hypothetical protein
MNEINIFAALMLLIACAGATLLYILWLEQELRTAPDSRTLVGRVIIGTWGAIRESIAWVFNKVGITTRT